MNSQDIGISTYKLQATRYKALAKTWIKSLVHHFLLLRYLMLVLARLCLCRLCMRSLFRFWLFKYARADHQYSVLNGAKVTRRTTGAPTTAAATATAAAAAAAAAAATAATRSPIRWNTNESWPISICPLFTTNPRCTVVANVWVLRPDIDTVTEFDGAIGTICRALRIIRTN
jgi:hypothetical protein